MLLPTFSITQEQGDELIFKETTPDFSPENRYGYGGPNVDVEEIVYATIKLSFGTGHTVEVGSKYNRDKAAWLIVAHDLPGPGTPNNPDGSCNHCNPFSDDDDKIYKDGFMRTFPSGCIKILYEVYTADANYPDGRKSAGAAISSIVLSFHEEQKFIETSFKLALPGHEQLVTSVLHESRIRETRRQFIVAWVKLKLVDSGCDCQCMENRIRQINRYLDSIK